jgi:hypothetical protein
VTDWIVRPYEAEDEGCVVSMWLKSFANAREHETTKYPNAAKDGHSDQVRFWRIHQPIVTGILGASTITVACDPARAEHKPGEPAVIWAWACVSEDTVHWVGVKRNAVQAGIGPDLVRALLGDRLDRPQATTFELVDLYRLKMIPAHWFRDRGFLSSLRSLSTRMLDRDETYARAGAHVLNHRREEWRQSSERAA